MSSFPNSHVFAGLEQGGYGAILCDPPWNYKTWSINGTWRSAQQHYDVMPTEEIAALPVNELAADDCALFLWVTWPFLSEALELIKSWSFVYKTCAFDWMKADNTQPSLFQESLPAQIGLGYWTRSNSEPCLLATRGKPKRLNADVRMGIIEPRREHSRKPDCTHERIERLVAGPYLEMFARRSARPGWSFWGKETGKFK
jgi:N6-adenosine-specific RNA methylase IME4